MKKMHLLLPLLAILFWSSPAFAQEAKETNKIVIIKKSVDENGVETIEKIIKEGTDSNVFMWNGENGEEMNFDIESDEDAERRIHIIMNGDNGEESFSWEGNEANMEELKEQLKELDAELGELNIELEQLNNENLFLNFSKNNSFSSCNDNTIKPFLGVVVKETIENENGEETVEGITEQGVIIEEIIAGSAAEAAGLKAGDVITAIDGQSTLRVAMVSETVQSKKVGDVVTVSYIRDGKAGQVTATLKGKPAQEFGHIRNHRPHRGHQFHFDFDYDFDYQVDPCKVFIGVYTSNGSSENGVRVNGVVDNTPASEAGLVTGDRILAIDGVSVASHNELLTERDKHQPGDAFTLTYVREGETYTVNATFKQCKENEKTGAVTEEETPENNAIERNVNNLLAIELEAFPNPTNSAVNIRFEGEKTATVVTVTDIKGKEIFRDVINNFDGIYNNKVNLNGAAAGTVIVSVQQGNKMRSEKVLYMPSRA